MVTIYIAAYDIIIKPVRILCYFWRSPLIIKLIYTQVIKYLLNHLIVFNKSEEIENWYYSNVRSLAQILNNKIKYENTLEAVQENPFSNHQIDNSGKAVSK